MSSSPPHTHIAQRPSHPLTNNLFSSASTPDHRMRSLVAMLRLILPYNPLASPFSLSFPCSSLPFPNCNTSCAIVNFMANDHFSLSAETACILAFLLIPSCPCLAACAAHYSSHALYFYSRPLLNGAIASSALALASPPCSPAAPALLSPFLALFHFSNRPGPHFFLSY